MTDLAFEVSEVVARLGAHQWWAVGIAQELAVVQRSTIELPEVLEDHPLLKDQLRLFMWRQQRPGPLRVALCRCEIAEFLVNGRPGRQKLTKTIAQLVSLGKSNRLGQQSQSVNVAQPQTQRPGLSAQAHYQRLDRSVTPGVLHQASGVPTIGHWVGGNAVVDRLCKGYKIHGVCGRVEHPGHRSERLCWFLAHIERTNGDGMKDNDYGCKPTTSAGDAGSLREPDQLSADTDVVARQQRALNRGRASRDFQRRIVELLAHRRREAAPETERFELVPGGSTGGTPIVAGALLVRATMKEGDPELFRELVAAVGAAEERLDGRLLVLSGADAGVDQLVELSRAARRRGHEVSVDHIVPLDVVCKGEGGPGRTLLDSRQITPPRPRDGAVRLSVIDTGVAVQGFEHEWHSALAGADNTDLLDAFPAPGGDGLLDAAAGHGAFATGIVQQVDPQGALSVLRAVDSDGIGSEVRVAEMLLQAVREEGAEIVNLSLGTQTLDDQPLLALQIAFELLSEGGHDDVLIVAAAGNFGDTRPCWPAAFRRVVAVAALTADMTPAEWSSHGHWVDVSTVGEGLVSTYVRGKESPDLSPAGQGEDEWPLDDPEPWAVWTGTSFAAPQLAAEVARRLTDAREAGDATATPRGVLSALLAGRPRIPDYGVAIKILSGTPVTG